MKKAPPPPNEAKRLEALLRYNIMDTNAETAYDDLVEIASNICQTPIALISLLDADRQWFKARVGLDAAQTHRDLAFCAHAIHQEDLFIVPDASHDERFFDNPLVTENPKIRFYAGAPLVTHDGYALGTICVIDQIPRELNENQLNALKALSRQVVSQLELRLHVMKLKTINTGKDKFFSLLSHDLKSPFNSILGFSKALQKRIHRMEQADILEAAGCIHNSAQTAHTLLSNLLEWSRFELGGIDFKPRMLELSSAVNHVFAVLKSQADEKAIRLEHHINPLLLAYADPQMLHSAMQNLVNNSIKFSKSGDSIMIKAENNEHETLISIQDQGIGIPPEKIDKLFNIDSYYTTEGTSGEKGTGLGTILCRNFIEKHGGRIWVESELGQGSTFYFTLPRQIS